jgi:hypothetical protein
MQFMHQTKRAICILSASGSISSASLRQSAAYGEQMTIEVQNYYDIAILTTCMINKIEDSKLFTKPENI